MARRPGTFLILILMVVLVMATGLNCLSGIAIFDAALAPGHSSTGLVAFYRHWVCEPFMALFFTVLPGSWPVLPWWVLDYFLLTSGLMIAINVVEYIGTGASSLGIVFRKDRTDSNSFNVIERCFFTAAFFLGSFFILPVSLLMLISNLPQGKDRSTLLVLQYCLALLVLSAVAPIAGKLSDLALHP